MRAGNEPLGLLGLCWGVLLWTWQSRHCHKALLLLQCCPYFLCMLVFDSPPGCFTA